MISIQQRERDHRDYEYIVASTPAERAFLTNFHKTHPALKLFFVYEREHCGVFEFIVFDWTDRKQLVRVDPWDVKYNQEFINALDDADL